jgi:hypothetical protein
MVATVMIEELVEKGAREMVEEGARADGSRLSLPPSWFEPPKDVMTFEIKVERGPLLEQPQVTVTAPALDIGIAAPLVEAIKTALETTEPDGAPAAPNPDQDPSQAGAAAD